ncbi:hypothetical protein SBOR_5888 [Sclerotinia borealis F-4128]|uniref:Uncharacterized protein n=1 Tax=Sclerotinia borealis (strain F-4128) TaxID=1432307 RepID=W9CCZ9_SCLBF|nr:hypothetical protein SBOR_5888 [Sclerotinia borealis F-4128]
MPVVRFLQNPLRTTAGLVASTSTTTRKFIQNHLATSTITTTVAPTATATVITTAKQSSFAPIQTLTTSFVHRGPSNILPAIADPILAIAMTEPPTNVHSNFPEFGNLKVTPYQLMYIVAVCVCVVILMSFCCCTDDIARYVRSTRNKNAGATVQAAPKWPGDLQHMDGANDTRSSNRSSRGNSTVRSSMLQPKKRSDALGSPTISQNPFTKITIKTCEEGHDSIIIDEIELRDLSSNPPGCDLSNNNPNFGHEYVTTNPRAHARNGNVSLRGGSGIGDNYMRTGAITSFKQTEERWKPTWSAAKSLFSTRRRQSEPIQDEAIRYSVSGCPDASDRTYPTLYNHDRSHQQSTTAASKRAMRMTNTSATTFSFPLSDGSDSEIPRFPTINRIKQKLKPLIHSVSRQSLRERFSSIDHSRDHSTEEIDSDELAYSNTVRKALRRARSSASVPFGLFKLPDPAVDDPESSAAGPVSVLSNYSASEYSDNASTKTMRARSPVGKLLGVSNRRSGAGSGSGSKIREPRRVTVPLGSYEGMVDDIDLLAEIDLGAVRAFSNLTAYEREREREIKPMSSTPDLDDKARDKNEDKQEDEDEGYIGDPRDDEANEEIHAPSRSTNSSQEENSGEVTENKQEQTDALPPSYISSTRSGHVIRSRKRDEQTAMASHFHARRARVGTDSTDGMGTLVAEKMERRKRSLGLLMIRGVTSGDGVRADDRRGGKVDWVTINLGGDD